MRPNWTTVAAEAAGGSAARVRGARAALVGALLLALTAVTGCQADAGTTDTSGTRAAPDPAADTAVRATIEAFNAAAAAGPADQQHRLADLVEPDRAAEVRNCPAATSTVRFEPVYGGLRAAGAPEPAGQTAADAAAQSYLLPALIRIYSGERVTGTDLTTLHLVVRPATGGGDSEAYLTPFCVN